MVGRGTERGRSEGVEGEDVLFSIYACFSFSFDVQSGEGREVESSRATRRGGERSDACVGRLPSSDC